MTQYHNLHNWTLEKLNARLSKKYNILNAKHNDLDEAIKDKEPLDETSLFNQIDALTDQINELEFEISKRENPNTMINIHDIDDIVLFESTKETISEALEEAVQKGVSLEYADLRGAYVKNVDLSNGNFKSAQLDGATFVNVNFRNCNLFNTFFGNSIFEKCKFLGCTWGKNGKMKNTEFIKCTK